MQIFETGWRNIVKPTQIKTRKHLLGPAQFSVDGQIVTRKDLQVINRNNKTISGFLYCCPDVQSNITVLYLHGNGGSKMQALSFIPFICKFKMNIAAFDLLGCGSSDSDVLTYGVNEVFDIRDMMQQIRKTLNADPNRKQKVSRVTLWGRSMGALCAIMFAQMYSYEVGGLVLDSPFRNLSKVVDRIAIRHTGMPEWIIKPALYLVKKKAAKQANYDIFSIDYLNIFKKINTSMPILFIFSHFDGVVPSEQVFEFYSAYKGPKDFCQIYQMHDEDRNEELFRQGMMWLTRTKRKNIQGLIQVREQFYGHSHLQTPNCAQNC